MSKNVVLSAAEIGRSLKRIAHEILEANRGPENLILVGIPTRGVHIAERLHQELLLIDPDYRGSVGKLDITMYRDDHGEKVRAPQESRIPYNTLDDLVVVLVDDVLFSGRTIRAAMDAVNDYGRPQSIRLAVLIDRGHRELPIRPDFVGKNLPTAKAERVNVELTEVDGVDQVTIQS